MEPKQPAGANHRDNIDNLICSRPAKWAEAPLQDIRCDCHDQRRAHASARQFGHAQDTQGSTLIIHAALMFRAIYQSCKGFATGIKRPKAALAKNACCRRVGALLELLLKSCDL